MIKIHPTRCEAVDDADDVVFTLEFFDADCFSLEVKTLVDTENWPRIAAAVELTLAYMNAGLTVADPLNVPAEVPDA